MRRVLEMKEGPTAGCLTLIWLLGHVLKFFIDTCASWLTPPKHTYLLWLFDPKSIEEILELFLRICLLDAPHRAGCQVCESQQLRYGMRVVLVPWLSGGYAVLNFGELFRRLTKIPKLRSLIKSGHSFQDWNDRHLERVVWPTYDLYCCLDPLLYWHERPWPSHLLRSLTSVKSLHVTHLTLRLAFYMMPWQKPWKHKLFKHQFDATEQGDKSNQLELDFPRFQVLWGKGSFSSCLNVA